MRQVYCKTCDVLFAECIYAITAYDGERLYYQFLIIVSAIAHVKETVVASKCRGTTRRTPK